MLRYLIGLLLPVICVSAEPPNLRLGDLDIRKPADVVWLNARDLTFDDAKFTQAGTTVAAKVESGGKEFAGFAPSSALHPGQATLRIAYHREFNKKDAAGLKHQDGAHEWIASPALSASSPRSWSPSASVWYTRRPNRPASRSSFRNTEIEITNPRGVRRNFI